MPSTIRESRRRVAEAPRPVPLDDRERAPIDWDAATPGGFYARHGHRLLDLVLLAIALPLALGPGLVIAAINALVFRDPRQVFFLQDRVGRRGKIFRIYKFRTMREARAGSLDSWSSGGDTLRVTRFGRFLRNAHLDELPQLINVLRGEMSFIGPRPEMVEIEEWAERNAPGFSRRLALRPGISGYAQITQGYTGCDVAAYERKREINELYLQRISLATDLEIVARTLVWMLRGKGWDWKPAGVADSTPESASGALEPLGAAGRQDGLLGTSGKTAA